MTERSSLLSKLSRPKLFRVVVRDRLFRMLDEGRRNHSVIWIAGPPGAGKTALIASYIDSKKLPGIWYQIDSGDNDPASFFYYLALAAQKVAGRKRLSLPLLTPEYLADLPGFTRRFFRELFTSLPAQAVLILDNYQEATPESIIHNVIQGAITDIHGDINLIIISRLDPPPQYAREIANNLLTQIGWEELRLTLSETSIIAASTGIDELDGETLQLLQVQTNGWAAGLILMMERLKRTGAINHISQSETMSFVFNYFAGQVFDQASVGMREFLMCTSILPRITVDMAAAISTNTKADELLDDLYRRRLFTDRRGGNEISYHYHALFREFLLDRGIHHFSPQKLHQLKHKAALLAKQDGDIEVSAQMLLETEDWEQLQQLIADHALVFLAQGRHQTLLKLISTLPASNIEDSGWIHYWLGLAQLPFDATVARQNLEFAFSIFDKADDPIGIYASWSEIMNVIFLELRDFNPVERWIQEFERIQTRFPKFPSLEIELRIYLAMGALVHRQPQHPLLRNWTERCVSLLDYAEQDLAILLGGHLILVFSYWSKGSKAQYVIDQLNPKIHQKGVSRMTYIFWHAVLATHYSWRGDAEACFKSVEKGLHASDSHGLHFFDFILQGQAAACNLTIGDITRAENWITLMTRNMHSDNYVEHAFYHHLHANSAAQRGDWQKSLEHARAGVAMTSAAGSPPLEGISHIDLVRALLETNNEAEGSMHLHIVHNITETTELPALKYLCFETAALASFNQGDESTGLRQLNQALVISRSIDAENWLLRGPKVSAYIYNRALNANLEIDHVRKRIRQYHLFPPDPITVAESWPWPVQVYTLGKFEVLCDGKQVRSSKKAQGKPLELLKCLCAFGGKSINQSRVTDALWPDAEGDVAEQALRTTLHRLRKLLHYDETIRMDDRHLSLNPNYIWVDCLAFDQAAHQLEVVDRISLQRTLNNYQGHFLEGETAHWALIFRQRLRASYKNMIERLGAKLENDRDWQGASACYRQAIEIEPLAETFYRQLMASYKQLDQNAEALVVYQRCRQLLLTHLGISPAPETQALYQALSAVK